MIAGSRLHLLLVPGTFRPFAANYGAFLPIFARLATPASSNKASGHAAVSLLRVIEEAENGGQ